jgi:DtxR family Mn-dependent transcriptional regulator
MYDRKSAAGASHYRPAREQSHSRATGEYLRLIFALCDEVGGNPQRASTNAIAQALDVQPASVTTMLQRLAGCEPALVDYRKRKGVLLTSAGRRAALEVIRGHRMLEQFLYRVMEFPWDEVHEEALRLQHAVSSAFVARMAALLDDPTHDPHGAPIPDRDLNLPRENPLRLGHVEAGAVVEVASVPDDDSALLRRFAADGLVPGRMCEVLAVAAPAGDISWRAVGEDQARTVGRGVAEAITVRRRDAS